MLMEVGKKYLVTYANWIYGPDGSTYIAIFGTVKSDNGYDLVIGHVTLSVDLIISAVRCDRVKFDPPLLELYNNEGGVMPGQALTTRILDADSDFYMRLKEIKGDANAANLK